MYNYSFFTVLILCYLHNALQVYGSNQRLISHGSTPNMSFRMYSSMPRNMDSIPDLHKRLIDEHNMMKNSLINHVKSNGGDVVEHEVDEGDIDPSFGDITSMGKNPASFCTCRQGISPFSHDDESYTPSENTVPKRLDSQNSFSDETPLKRSDSGRNTWENPPSLFGDSFGSPRLGPSMPTAREMMDRMHKSFASNRFGGFTGFNSPQPFRSGSLGRFNFDPNSSDDTNSYTGFNSDSDFTPGFFSIPTTQGALAPSGQGSNYTGERIDDNDLAKLREMLLKRHNEYRSKHEAQPLKLDDRLNESSQKYAEYCLEYDVFDHSPESKQIGGPGENLSQEGPNSDPNYNFSPTEAVDGWYNEINSYNFNAPGFSMSTGHFTQVVWKSSAKLGCGIATRRDGSGATRIVVCQYTPRGNSGGYVQNVVKPKN